MVVFVFFLCVSLKYSYIYDVLFVNIKKGNYEVWLWEILFMNL